MDRIFALYKRELRAYFNSPIAYIVLIVPLIAVGYFFFQTFFAGGQASLRFFFRVAAWSFLIFAPAVTMKLVAEEKRTGTIEPLLTLPIQEWQVVLAKFFAAWTLLAVYLLFTLIYPITIAFIGDLDPGPVVGGYLGLFFLGGTFVSLGLFASTISRNQVISLIVAFVIALFLFLLDVMLPFVPAALRGVFEFLGADAHFQNISRGVIDTRDAIYSLSFMAFFLFLSVQALQTRLTDHSRAWRLNRVVYIGAAAGCLILLNVISANAHTRIDLTDDQRFTLSPATKEILGELNDQLTVTAFFSKELPPPADANAATVRDLLEEYRAASDGKMSFEFVDPDAAGKDGQPDQALLAAAQTAGVPKIDVRTFSKDQVQMVKVYMGLALRYGEKTESIPVVQNVPDLEYEVTSRVAKMLRERPPTVGFLAGHGEMTTATGLKNALTALGDKYKSQDIDVAKDAAALDNIDVLVIAGPKSELGDAALYAVDQYVMRGGNAAFLIDRETIDVRSSIGRGIHTGLEDLAAAYGVTVEPKLVLDTLSERIAIGRQQGGMTFQSIVQYPLFVHVQDINQDTPVTKNLSGFTMPFVSPLTIAPEIAGQATVIARSSANSWLFEYPDSFLVDPPALPQPTPEAMVGPQNLLVTIDGSETSAFAGKPHPAEATAAFIDASPKVRLAIVGTSQWIADELPNRLDMVLFANLVDWLAQDERLIGVRTRSIENRPLKQIGDATRTAFKFGNMFTPPLILVAIGLVRWRLRARRKRRGFVVKLTPANGR